MRPLLAADWLQIAIFLFIIFSSLIGQAYKAVQQQKKAPKRAPRPPVPPVPPAEGGEVVAKAERPQTAIEKEIEAFLRRTLGQPEKAQPPSAQPTKPKPRQRAATASGKPATTRPAVGKQLPSSQPRRPVPARPSADEPQPFATSESVAEHVERHIQRGGVAERDTHLGEQLGRTDERLESHLQDVFQHRLGSLARGEGRAGAGIEQGTDAGVWVGRRDDHPLAAELHQMLTTPQKLQVAVILSEVLRRPEERWS
jgi:hypothetical protein